MTVATGYLVDTHVWLWYARGDLKCLPADATARHHDLTLIAKDCKVLNYQQGHLHACSSNDKELLNR